MKSIALPKFNTYPINGQNGSIKDINQTLHHKELVVKRHCKKAKLKQGLSILNADKKKG